ncbi:MAG: hypothetical protein JOZ45_06995 [Acidobacteriaceae bacterium]|nr:hypothetical protein [Acidobacteriaceae bacterium]
MVTGTIKNLTQSPIKLCEHFTLATASPELSGQIGTPGGYYARLTINELSLPLESDPNNAFWNTVILQAGSAVKAHWYIGPTSNTSSDNDYWFLVVGRQIATELRYLFFSPGDYKVHTEVAYTILDKQGVLETVSASVEAARKAQIAASQLNSKLDQLKDKLNQLNDKLKAQKKSDIKSADKGLSSTEQDNLIKLRDSVEAERDSAEARAVEPLGKPASLKALTP